MTGEVVSLTAIARQQARERIELGEITLAHGIAIAKCGASLQANARRALSQGLLAIGEEMQENGEDFQAAARKEIEAGRAELRALDAAETKSAS